MTMAMGPTTSRRPTRIILQYSEPMTKSKYCSTTQKYLVHANADEVLATVDDIKDRYVTLRAEQTTYLEANNRLTIENARLDAATNALETQLTQAKEFIRRPTLTSNGSSHGGSQLGGVGAAPDGAAGAIGPEGSISSTVRAGTIGGGSSNGSETSGSIKIPDPVVLVS